jgi:hypothetical protein
VKRCGALAVLCLAAAVLAAPQRADAYPLLAQQWRDLSPKERYDAMRNYDYFQRLPQDRKQDVERDYERWRNMPPDKRDRVRQNYQRFERLGPREREQFERKYQKWKQQAEPPR